MFDSLAKDAVSAPTEDTNYLADSARSPPADILGCAVETRSRDEVLIATITVDLVPFGTLGRSEYKTKLLDFTGASEAPP